MQRKPSGHNPHNRNRYPIRRTRRSFDKRPHDRERPASNKDLVDKLRNHPEKLATFAAKVAAYWHTLNKTQKFLAIVVMALAAGVTGYMLLRLIMRLSLNHSGSDKISNRLNPIEQDQVNKKLRSKVVIEPTLLNVNKKNNARLQEFETFKQHIADTLSDNGVTTRLHAKVVDSQNFGIDISIRDRMGGEDAVYEVKGNRVQFAVCRFFFPKETSTAFMNEMHHASISMRNKELGCPRQGLRDYEPFCDQKKQKWSKEKVIELARAIEQGCERINYLYNISLSMQSKKHLQNPSDITFYNQSIAALKTFQPQTETTETDNEVFIKYTQPKLQPETSVSGFSLKMKRKVMQKECRYPIYSDFYFKILDKNAGSVILRYQIGSDQDSHALISSLLTLINIQRSSVINPDSGYSKKGLGKDYAVAELASYIDSLPATVKSHFFREFCDYFSKYFNVDYCNHEDPAAYRP